MASTDPLFEFINSEMIAEPLLREDQQPTFEEGKVLRDLTDYILPLPPPHLDPQYRVIHNSIRRRDNLVFAQGWRQHKEPEHGSNPIVEGRPLCNVSKGTPATKEDERPATCCKESSTAQAATLNQAVPFGQYDTRNAGLNMMLNEPRWDGDAWDGLATCDGIKNENFEEFVKGAMLEAREGPPPDANDTKAVVEYAKKPVIRN